jgi:hypothetical protein
MDTIKLATAGLGVAWLVHDTEEWFTLQDSSRRMFARLPERIPLPPGWREEGLPPEHVAVGISTMAVVMAAASADGYRTRGRSPFYRTVLTGFGLHGLGHLGSALVTRDFTTGVRSSPVVVIPFWWWARRQLAAEGVSSDGSPAWALAGIPLIWAVHGLAYALTRRRVAARRARAVHA